MAEKTVEKIFEFYEKLNSFVDKKKIGSLQLKYSYMLEKRLVFVERATLVILIKKA